MDLGLTGKTVAITGASKGLGFAVAKQFTIEGANIAINSRNEANIQDAANRLATISTGKILSIPGDVTNNEFATQFVNGIQKHFGKLDILITNAGGPKPAPFESLTDQDWHDAINLSFMSHVRLIRASLPLLRKSESPSVLTITSYSAKQPIPNLVLSNALRAAVIGLTKTLALELANEKIRFNSILPGWTKTERVDALLTNRASVNNSSIEIEREKITQEIPLGRMAETEEFAKTAVFLASPAASYLTGIMLTVDGGIVKGTL